MKRLKEYLRALSKVPRLSPSGFLLYAALIMLLYLLLHALGLREYTSVICGNPATIWGSYYLTVVFAGLYIIFYFGLVIVVPILLVASAVFLALQRLLWRRTKKTTPQGHTPEPADG